MCTSPHVFFVSPGIVTLRGDRSKVKSCKSEEYVFDYTQQEIDLWFCAYFISVC